MAKISQLLISILYTALDKVAEEKHMALQMPESLQEYEKILGYFDLTISLHTDYPI